MTAVWSLTIVGLHHTTVVLRDRKEARKLLAHAKYAPESAETKALPAYRPVRFWDVYANGMYLGLLSCRVEKS